MPTWTGSQPHRGGTGAAVLRARVTPGDAIVHDAFYWVPLLLYYTGARREEICKLCPGDVKLAPIPHIFIDFTDFGRIKNDQSVRPVPLHRELVRLGFLQFVEECRKRGYPVLFPELTPTNDVQKFGDIYYKNVWANLKRAAKLADDATNHGMRHRFSTDLKAKKVFSEFRRDVMGQGGLDINEERYSDTAAMEILKGIIEELPSVTDALQPGKAIVPPRVIRRPKPSMRRK
jgi:integrase